MGAYTSTRIIGQQEAQNVLGAAVCRRIEDGFVRLVSALSTSPGGQRPTLPRGSALIIDRKALQVHVLEAYPYVVRGAYTLSMCTMMHSLCLPIMSTLC